MKDSKDLIDLIDSRIIKMLPQKNNVVYKYAAKITSVYNNSQAKARIAGYDSEYTLLNKSGETLKVGDSVFIEAIGNNITGGFISERFRV